MTQWAFTPLSLPKINTVFNKSHSLRSFVIGSFAVINCSDEGLTLESEPFRSSRWPIHVLKLVNTKLPEYRILKELLICLRVLGKFIFFCLESLLEKWVMNSRDTKRFFCPWCILKQKSANLEKNISPSFFEPPCLIWICMISWVTRAFLVTYWKKDA